MMSAMTTLVDLSHPLHIGQVTHPGLPAPEWEAFRSREDYERETGTTFQIDRVAMVGNTGTYLDSPFHRYADGRDLAALPLTAVADLPIVVVEAQGHRAVTVELLVEQLDRGAPGVDLEGCAVLLHTGGDREFGAPAYAEQAPFLTGAGAEWLADRDVALVGIDAVNIDALEDLKRPAHTGLLGRGVLVLEHLTNLDALAGVASAGRLHAAPPAWHGIGTWPVRAYAVIGRAGV
jgi:arylformamidase